MNSTVDRQDATVLDGMNDVAMIYACNQYAAKSYKEQWDRCLEAIARGDGILEIQIKVPWLLGAQG